MCYHIIQHRQCCNEPRQYGYMDPMLCQTAEHFLYIGIEEMFIAVSYKKHWKLLIDKDMKVCTALDCGVGDIMEIKLKHLKSNK